MILARTLPSYHPLDEQASNIMLSKADDSTVVLDLGLDLGRYLVITPSTNVT